MTSAIDPAGDMNRMFTSVTVGDHVVTLREIDGYGPAPWQIGLTFEAAEINRQLTELQRTAWVGVAILVVAVALGLIMGRVFTRHIRALSQTATRLATLDVANAGTLPDSRFRELAEASRAFNATTAGLKWFETYVPKSLVLRLMQRGAEATRSQERVLTVMFTDIRGFSTMSERMSAPDIAAMLNRHFEILSSRIEAEGGAPSTSSSAIR